MSGYKGVERTLDCAAADIRRGRARSPRKWTGAASGRLPRIRLALSTVFKQGAHGLDSEPVLVRERSTRPTGGEEPLPRSNTDGHDHTTCR